MKNSKEYTKKIAGLYQSLKKKGAKITPPEAMPVVDSLIYGIISEKLTEKDADSAIKRFGEYFVDWNDLRVSKPEEIAEELGENSSENREIALTLTKVLQKIYNEFHQVELESLHKLGKRQARQKLEKMEELSRYAIDYCMLTSLASHAIPITETMIEYLQSNDLVDSSADAAAIEGFLAKQISAKNGYEFYKLLRHESETNIRKSARSSKKNDAGGQEKVAKAVKKTKKKAKSTRKEAAPRNAKTITTTKKTKRKK